MSQAIQEALERAQTELRGLAEGDAAWTDEQRIRVDELKNEIADLEERARILDATKPAERAAAPANDDADVRMVAKPATASTEVREKSPYAEDNSQASWFQDVFALRNRDASDAEVSEARERLTQHYKAARDEGGVREARTLSSTTESQGGYLVPPTYAQDMFARLLVNGSTVMQLMGKMPLPPKTDQIRLPKVTSGTAIAQHTQNNDLTSTDPVFEEVTFGVFRYGGANTIPNFLLDRSLPGVDQVILGDLARQLAAKLDTDLINGSGTGASAIEGLLNADSIGTATATAGTATMSEVWPAIVNAIADVQSAHYANPDAIVMHPRRWAWMLAQIDADKRPLIGGVSPINAVANFPGLVAPPEGLEQAAPVGSILGVPVYLDSNIPTNLGSGTDEDRILVGVFREAILMTSTPKFGMSTEAQFLKDQTLVRVTQDVAATFERYPGAFSVISGTALNDLA